jgi:hypothetical protein
MTDFTDLTGKPPSPSPIGGHLLLLRLSSVLSSFLHPHHPTGLPAEDALRSRSPLAGYAYRLGLGGDWSYS